MEHVLAINRQNREIPDGDHTGTLCGGLGIGGALRPLERKLVILMSLQLTLGQWE